MWSETFLECTMSNSLRYTVEFDLKQTPTSMLWTFIATPSGLEKWFADKVTQSDNEITFAWEGQESRAIQATNRAMNCAKYRWCEPNERGEITQMEMRISVSELTKTTVLSITDFVAYAEELEEAKELWEHQVETLKRVVGCK